jgi:hypothetical protein
VIALTYAEDRTNQSLLTNTVYLLIPELILADAGKGCEASALCREAPGGAVCATLLFADQYERVGRSAAQAEQLDISLSSLSGRRRSGVVIRSDTHHFELQVRIAEYERCSELHQAVEMNDVLVHSWFFDIAIERRTLPRYFTASRSGLSQEPIRWSPTRLCVPTCSLELRRHGKRFILIEEQLAVAPLRSAQALDGSR